MSARPLQTFLGFDIWYLYSIKQCLHGSATFWSVYPCLYVGRSRFTILFLCTRAYAYAYACVCVTLCLFMCEWNYSDESKRQNLMGVHLLTNKAPRLSLITGLHLIKLNDFTNWHLHVWTDRKNSYHIVSCSVLYVLIWYKQQTRSDYS